MSLDIGLINKETGEEVMSLNWFRNPFGLERWAESNVGEKSDMLGEPRLWYVCNHWNSAESGNVDRKLFKQVVDEYWIKIQELEVGYFVFNLPTYRQFVEGVLKYDWDYTVRDFEYRNNNTEIAIKMGCFDDVRSLDGYKQWFQQLVLFAERLQDTDLKFYCSN